MVKIVKPYNENNVLSIALDNAQFEGIACSEKPLHAFTLSNVASLK
jgi:hypothetical protein